MFGESFIFYCYHDYNYKICFTFFYIELFMYLLDLRKSIKKKLFTKNILQIFLN